ncbi:MAG TPA: DedA family protein [Burkholderiales bacterium]|nr:DedA family protein [Burkholderiales bacterium]
MDILLSLWDVVMHLDRHLAALVQEHGVWVYAVLFAIIFCETGLVVTPFLPGDSLLFVAGAVWAISDMDAHILALTLIVAALCGDNVNYWIGRVLGPKVFKWEDSRFFNRKALDRTHAFYEKHGGKTIIIARFVPIVRTFVPFVAGIGKMTYAKFLSFSVIGALVWVLSLVYAGYFFGNIAVVKNNLSIVIFGIIGLSLMPLVLEYWKARRARLALQAPANR